MRDVVVTWLLTSAPDPQRAVRWTPDEGVLATLRDSVKRHGAHLVVLHDEMTAVDDDHTTFVRVPSGVNPYWHRWAVTRDHLRAHPEYRWVWCVDGSDTEMLNDPFGSMAPGTLYVGGEGKPLGESRVSAWLRGSCPTSGPFLDAHPDLEVVNVGVTGGERYELLTLATLLANADTGVDAWEMGAFQRIVHDWHGPVVSGLTVTTPFLTNDSSGPSWWRHK